MRGPRCCGLTSLFTTTSTRLVRYLNRTYNLFDSTKELPPSSQPTCFGKVHQ
ncbi:hypothetical protein PR003_g26937 [Phytophthora rubi]|uniref:Uncharacterized protein n=1 Tax=Phytophthora rubi TaxID=129364 RepID=A0A6A4CBB1_9STRA|nr:hypothetical protein PR003_g26937 [Phytophthora rubi]